MFVLLRLGGYLYLIFTFTAPRSCISLAVQDQADSEPLDADESPGSGTLRWSTAGLCTSLT